MTPLDEGAPDGQTPIDPDEAKGLLLVVRTQEALNRAEEENILRARIWAARSRLVRGDLLSDRTLDPQGDVRRRLAMGGRLPSER